MFETIIDAINTFLYSKLLIVILIGSGIYFTIRTRFPQVRLFRNACNAVMEKPEGKESVSSFQALINIPVILILSNTALKALKDYERQIRQKKNPVFFSKNIDLKQKTDYWNETTCE